MLISLVNYQNIYFEVVWHFWSTKSMQMKWNEWTFPALKWAFLRNSLISWVVVLGEKRKRICLRFFPVFPKPHSEAETDFLDKKKDVFPPFFCRFFRFLPRSKMFAKKRNTVEKRGGPLSLRWYLLFFEKKKRVYKLNLRFLGGGPPISERDLQKTTFFLI